MPRDGIDAGLVRAHFGEERVVRLQVQHARALPVVQRVRERVLLLVQLVAHVQVDVSARSSADGHVRIVLVHDDVLLGGPVLGDDFDVRFVVRIGTVVLVRVVHVSDDVPVAGYDPLVRIPVRVVRVDQEVILAVVHRRRRVEPVLQVRVDVSVYRLAGGSRNAGTIVVVIVIVGQTGSRDDAILKVKVEVMVARQAEIIVVWNLEI